MIGFTVITSIVFKKHPLSTVMSPGKPIDAITRRQRIRAIRNCKLLVLVLVLCLLYGLLQFDKAFPFPDLVGIIINLCFMAGLICVIVRLQRSLR